MKRKLLALITSILLLCTMIPLSAVSVGAATNITLTELQKLYPDTAYWNHAKGEPNNADGYTWIPCTHHVGNCDLKGQCGCNSYRGNASQCAGFAFQMASVVYGEDSYSWPTKYREEGKKAVDSLKAGDVVRYRNGAHVIFITAVEGNVVTYGDCNDDGHCQIQWDKTIKKDDLKATTTWVTVAPYEWESGSSTVSHTIDTTFGRNFTAYPKEKITAENIFDVTHDMINSTSWIGTSDECIIHEVYTDGCCKVSYPLDAGGNKTVYSKIALFNMDHTCNKGEYMWFWKDHPHYACYKCSICDAVWYDESETNFLDSCLDCTLPGKPELADMQLHYSFDEDIVFKWADVKNATHYRIWIEVKNEQDEWVKYEHLPFEMSGLAVQLPMGEYRCVLQAYNSNYYWEDGSDWQYTESDWYYFMVEYNHTYGDANGDDSVNARDAALLQQFVAGWDVIVNETSADANGDGSVNARDAALLQQYVAGWDVELG